MTYPPVLTKTDFVRRYKLGEFGNRAPTWNNVLELEESGYKGLVHLRNKIVGGVTYYNLTPSIAAAMWERLGNGFYCSGMAPHQFNVMQGEYQDGNLTYSTVAGLPMREALAKKTQHATGIIASFRLRIAMCPNSYDWFQELLRRYPGHVIEFSSFNRNWGTLPHFNTVFWEVRMY